MAFEIGDEVRYLGTKSGKTNAEWEAYFGRFGVKKGDVGRICSISRGAGDGTHYFIQDDIRDGGGYTSGYLLKKDIEPVVCVINNWREILK